MYLRIIVLNEHALLSCGEAQKRLAAGKAKNKKMICNALIVSIYVL